MLDPYLLSNWVGRRINPTTGQIEIYIRAGEFMAGQQANNVPDGLLALPPERVSLPGYWISQTQVTNAQYQACQAAGACVIPVGPDHNPHYYDPEFAQHPVVFITWFDAQDFCSWAGGRLPTELEWEKAARGVGGADFPWGDSDDVLSFAHVGRDVEHDTTVPVGSYPEGASPYGALDMGGNVREWVGDWFDEDRKVLRGASWFDPPRFSFTFTRLAHVPDSPGHNRGFRCAFDH